MVAGKSWCQTTNVCFTLQASGFSAHARPLRRVLHGSRHPGGLYDVLVVPSDWSRRRGLADRAHVPAVPSDPCLCGRGWKMCALLLARDEPPVPPPISLCSKPMATTGLLYVVCLQQECSQPCSPRSCAKRGTLELITCCQPRSWLPTSPAQKTIPGPGRGQHVALTLWLSWPGTSPWGMALDGCIDF